MPHIDVIVSPQGESRVETQGFQGPACLQASEFVEQALGRMLSERTTAEFHQPTIEQSRHETESQ